MNIFEQALTTPSVVVTLITVLLFVLLMNLLEIRKVRKLTAVPLSQREGAVRVLIPAECEYEIKVVGSAPAELFTEGGLTGFYLVPGFNRVMFAPCAAPESEAGKITTLLEAKRGCSYILVFNGAGEPVLAERDSEAQRPQV